MPMKFDYVLVEQCTKEALASEVGKLLEKGYLFVGGGSASSHQHGNDLKRYEVGYLQAMILYEG